jgi:hypothetical protein
MAYLSDVKRKPPAFLWERRGFSLALNLPKACLLPTLEVPCIAYEINVRKSFVPRHVFFPDIVVLDQDSVR